MRGRPRLLLLLAVLIVVAACSARVSAVDAPTIRAWLPFVQDGHTTRAQLRGVFGVPSREFETGRIVTYRLRRADDGLKAAPRYEEPDAPYELVLVFDPRHILVRHSLVRLW